MLALPNFTDMTLTSYPQHLVALNIHNCFPIIRKSPELTEQQSTWSMFRVPNGWTTMTQEFELVKKAGLGSNCLLGFQFEKRNLDNDHLHSANINQHLS